MVCLDTDLLVGLVRDDRDAVAAISALEDENTPLSTTSITAYELLKGAQRSRESQRNLALVREVLENLHVMELDKGASEKAAALYQRLQEEGGVIGEFDILIAAICMSNQVPIITRDRHFSNIPGLQVRGW